jgi:hypothetical protein
MTAQLILNIEMTKIACVESEEVQPQAIPVSEGGWGQNQAQNSHLFQLY